MNKLANETIRKTMKQPKNDEDIWTCGSCGQRLGKHHCPDKQESPVVAKYIDKIESRNKKLEEGLLLVAECQYDSERKIKDVPFIFDLLFDHYHAKVGNQM